MAGVLLLAAGGVLWSARPQTFSVRTGNYAEVLQAARSEVVDLTSFHYLTLDDDIQQAKRLTTGDLQQHTVDRLHQTRQQVTDAQAVVSTEVVGAAVTRADREHGTVVLFIRSTQKNNTLKQAQALQFQIQVELLEVDGRWVLSGIAGRQGGIIDTAEQVSATTRLDVSDIGLQQVDDAQDAARLVVFGDYVTKSVNSGSQPAPDGSACQVTSEGAQSYRQIMRVHVIRLHGAWKIDQVTVLTGAWARRGYPPVAAWRFHGARPFGIMARARARRAPAPESAPSFPGVALVARRPPTWTARRSRGRVTCCAAL